MASDKMNNFLIPNITRLPNKKKEVPNTTSDSKVKEEFKNLLNQEINQVKNDHGISLSIHAARRMRERNMSIDSDEFFKLKGAIDKLKAKGGQDSLVITKNAAYIVDAKNNKIVTAIDKENMAENVFTKIDSTVIIN